MTKIIEKSLGISENELLNELVKEYSVCKRMPGDVSARDMAKATGWSENWCGELLRQKYLDGKLLRIRVIGENKQPIVVYRKP